MFTWQALLSNQRASRLVLALAAVFAAVPVQAQNFEAFFGEVATQDRGEDVKSVRNCPGGGSIVAGSRRFLFGDVEALITRVDDFGVTLWQRAYRVGDSGFSQANGVIEYRDGSGFAVTGSASPSDTRIYAMRIDCDGEPRWTTLLDNQAGNNRGIGYDIIEVPSSSATLLAGDVIVVGDERFPVAGGTTHGRIARVDGNGSVIYNNAYIEPASIPGLRFRAVALARASTGLMTDLVLAGSAGRFTDWSFDRRGLMFRARLDGSPVCNAMLGVFDSPSEDFSGVTSISSQAFLGQTVLAGAFTPGPVGVAQQGYLTRFRSGNCAPLEQSRWPFPGESAEILDVVELPTTAAMGPPRFAVTGTVRSAANPSDGFIASGTVSNLAPIPFQRFGMQAPGVEALRALDLKNGRLLAAGNTDRDWEGVGDPRDLYLVQTDNNLRTQCSITWTILPNDPNQPMERFEPVVRKIQTGTSVDSPSTDTTGSGYCCALAPG